MELLQVEHIR